MDKKDISNIVGILKYGWFEGTSLKKILFVYILFVTFILFMMGIGIIMFTMELRNDISIFSFITLLILFVLVLLILPILFLFLIIKNEKIRKQVNLWLNDAIKVKAVSKEAGRKYQFGILYVKLQVDFDVGEMHYTKYSESLNDKTTKEGGYYLIWKKYVNKQIDILYSPKYDQVLILKDNKIKTE